MKILKKEKIKYNFINFIIILVIFVGFYFLLPKLLNFPEYFDNILFQIEVIGIPLLVYFVILGIITIIIEKVIDMVLMRRINKFIRGDYEKNDKKFISQVRDDCMNMPYKYMIVQFLILAVIVGIAIVYFVAFGKIFITNFEKLKLSIIRVSLLIVAVWLLLSVIRDYFIQKFVNLVLNESYINNRFYKKNDKTVSNAMSVIIQIVPIIITIFVIFICFSYANTVDVTSKAISTYYKVYFDKLDYDDKESFSTNYLITKLQNEISLWDESNVLFVIDYNENIVTSTGEKISDFMLAYKDKYFYYVTDENENTIIDLTNEDNIIYESYGIDEHAYIRVVKDEYGRSYYVGVKYLAGNEDNFMFLVYVSIGMFVIYVILLMYWAKNNATNMKRLEQNMAQILSEKDIMKKNFMPILSNDEIGNASYYYNKIQDKLYTQRDIMFKQEQLSALRRISRWNGT